MNSAIAIPPTFTRIYSAEPTAGWLVLVDNTTGATYTLNLPNVDQVGNGQLARHGSRRQKDPHAPNTSAHGAKVRPARKALSPSPACRCSAKLNRKPP